MSRKAEQATVPGPRSRAAVTWEIGTPATRHVETADDYRTHSRRLGPAGPAEMLDPDQPPGDTLSTFPVGRWWVLVELGDVDGRLEAIRVQIHGYAHAQDGAVAPISAADLRHVRFGELIDAARREYLNVATGFAVRLSQRRPDVDEVVAEVLETAQQHIATAETTRPKRGRRRLEFLDDYEAAVAAYEKAVATGSRHPNVEVSEELGISSWDVAKRIARARKLGRLPPTRRGVARA